MMTDVGEMIQRVCLRKATETPDRLTQCGIRLHEIFLYTA